MSIKFTAILPGMAPQRAAWALAMALFSWLGPALQAQPVITGVAPASGPMGATVTISGSNFGANPAVNIVYFGAVRAVVTAATPNSLEVSVPVGATYQPLTVTVGGLTTQSSLPFRVTFSSARPLDASAFQQTIASSAGAGDQFLIGDIDGDGKPDIIATRDGQQALSILRNTSEIGSLFFDPAVDLQLKAYDTCSAAIADLDGDGKLDLIVGYFNNPIVSVFRNTSSAGQISFAPRVDFDISAFAPSTRGPPQVADLDGDGKPDIVVNTYGSALLIVLRNVSSPGDIHYTSSTDSSFQVRQLPVGTTTATWNAFAIGDLDGDGKPDLIMVDSTWIGGIFCTQMQGAVYECLNASSPGKFAFNVTPFHWTGGVPWHVVIGDINGDSKLDFVTLDLTCHYAASQFLSKGLSGNYVDFTQTRYGLPEDGFGRPVLADLNGDGLLELLVPESHSATAVLAPDGTTEMTLGGAGQSLAVGDLDGDGRPEIVAGFGDQPVIAVFRNMLGPPAQISPKVTVVLHLIDSNGMSVAGGKAQYYSGGWQDVGVTGTDGTLSIDLPPASYTFSMDYAFARVQTTQDTSANSTVIFQTRQAMVRLQDSAGTPVAGGTAQYYASGWKNIGLTAVDGTASIELLPTEYTFRINSALGTVQKVQDISLQSAIVFQAKHVVLALLDSLGNPLTGGKAEYYLGRWQNLGVTGADGTASTELLADRYTFSVDYAFTHAQQVQDIDANAVVIFQTRRAAVRLHDSTGGPLAGGKVQYCASAWRDAGFTGTDGTLSLELFPATYSFSMDYAFGRVQEPQNLNTSSFVVFQTGRVHSASGSCRQYFDGGWHAFANSSELLPMGFTFRFSDTTPDTLAIVLAGAMTTIH